MIFLLAHTCCLYLYHNDLFYSFLCPVKRLPPLQPSPPPPSHGPPSRSGYPLRGGGADYPHPDSDLSDRERRLQRILTLERELKQEMNTLYEGGDEAAYYGGNQRILQSVPPTSYPIDHYGRRSPQRKDYDHYSRREVSSTAPPPSGASGGGVAPRRDFPRAMSPRQRPQGDPMQARAQNERYGGHYGNRYAGGYPELGGRPPAQNW